MKNFKKILQEIEPVLNDQINQMSLDEMNECYNKINDILANHKYSKYDFNRTLLNFPQKKNKVFMKLSDLVFHRNSKINELACTSDKYEEFSKDIRLKLNDIFTEIDDKIIQNAFTMTLNKYLNYWMGPWSIVTINNDGSILSILLIDNDDFYYFISRISDNCTLNDASKWIMKDKRYYKEEITSF